jgi:outer membrane protein assembly factor BamB
MIQSARAFAAVLVGMAVAGSSWGVLARSAPPAADDPHDARHTPAAAPPQTATPVGESPRVFLFRGGQERTGSISGSHLPEHPAVHWIVPLEGDPGEPLLADGVIYVGDRSETIYAIALTDGSIRWRARGLGFIYCAPAKRGDTVYVPSHGLTALSQSDGRVLWSCELPGVPADASPLIVKDRIVVADDGGHVSAVGFDGKRIWQHDIAADEPPSSPGFEGKRARLGGTAARLRTAASDGIAVFQPIFDQSRLAVIDLKAGRRRWSFQAKGWIYGVPTVADDRVFFGSQDKHLYCLDKRKKTMLWSFPTQSRIEAGPGYRDGSVFFGSCDGRFYRVDAETGKEIWSYQTPGSPGASTAIYSAPLCTEDAVYFGSMDGYLYALRIVDGQLKWRIRPVEGSEITSSPLTDGRRIVLGIRRNSEKQGRHAIVVIGERERKGPPVRDPSP